MVYLADLAQTSKQNDAKVSWPANTLFTSQCRPYVTFILLDGWR